MSLKIDTAPKLRSLRGLEGLTEIKRDELWFWAGIIVEEAPLLKDLTGLDNLVVVGGRGAKEGDAAEGGATFRGLDGLESANGLQKLRRGVVSFSYNPKLRDLSALHGFEQGDMWFGYNASLPVCEIDKLRAAVAGRDVRILAEPDLNGSADPKLCD